MKQRVFISYCNEESDVDTADREVADRICSTLESHGIPCWIAHRDIIPGDKWMEIITDAIGQAEIVILVFSENTEKSKWVVDEITLAKDENKTIIPFRIQKVFPQRALKLLKASQWLDAFTPPLENYLNQLVEVVFCHLGKEPGKPPEYNPLEPEIKPKPEYVKADRGKKRNEPETLAGDVKNIKSKDKERKVEKNYNRFLETNYSDGIVSKESNKHPERIIILKEIAQPGNLLAFVYELHQRWVEKVLSYPVYYEEKVFLSCNHQDEEKVKTLKQLLKTKGIRNVWFDIDDLHVGEHQDLIKEEIKKCKVFIPLISNNSLTNNQGYMWTIEWACIENRLNSDKYYGKMSFQIIPIVLDDTARDDERIPKLMRDFTTIMDLDTNKDRIIEEITKELTPIMKK